MTFNISSAWERQTHYAAQVWHLCMLKVLEHSTMNIIGEFHSYQTIPTINTALTVILILYHWLYAHIQDT